MRGPQLTLTQEREVRLLRDAIALLLPGSRLDPFDDELFVGSRERVDGVQWHVALDRQYGTRRFAVNLEGLAYRDWPIARFIRRELENPKLLDVIRSLAQPDIIEVHLTRDAWKGPRTRVAVEEWSLLGPRTLTALTPEAWRRALVEAANCLAGPAGGRGSKQLTRLNRLGREDFEVSPHLNLGLTLASRGTPQQRAEEMRSAMQQLRPLHRFVELASS